MKKPPFENTPRVEWKNGAWRYRPKKHELEQYGNKSWYRIGVNEHDVYEFLASRSRALNSQVKTIGQALDRYQYEVLPKKAYKTQESNRTSIARIRNVFGHHFPQSLEYADFIFYRDAVGEVNGRKAANSDLEVISHLYTMLIEWGAIQNKDHPLRGMKYKYPLESRDRYVSHEEIIEAHKVAGDFLKIYIPFKLKTALDQKTIVSIKLEDVTPEGIYYRRTKLARWDTGKQGKLKLIVWDDELKLLVGRIARLRGIHDYLFCNARGRQYVDKNGTAQPIRRAWARLKAHMASLGKPISYTEHDLRAKSLSDEVELTVAIQRGDHSSGTTTSRVYRRKAEPVMPLHLGDIGLEALLEIGDMDAHVAEFYWHSVIQK